MNKSVLFKIQCCTIIHNQDSQWFTRRQVQRLRRRLTWAVISSSCSVLGGGLACCSRLDGPWSGLERTFIRYSDFILNWSASLTSELGTRGLMGAVWHRPGAEGAESACPLFNKSSTLIGLMVAGLGPSLAGRPNFGIGKEEAAGEISNPAPAYNPFCAKASDFAAVGLLPFCLIFVPLWFVSRTCGWWCRWDGWSMRGEVLVCCSGFFEPICILCTPFVIFIMSAGRLCFTLDGPDPGFFWLLSLFDFSVILIFSGIGTERTR